MTPYNFVNMSKIMGLDIVALTDHNTCLNCPAAIKAGEEAGLLVIPGMELCTSEEIHVVCLFESLDNALRFSEYVRSTMPPIKNREKIFGEQLIMDEKDGIIGKEEILLTTASSIGIYQVPKLMEKYGGVAFPAHINRASYSVISNLGEITAEMGFHCAELTPDANLSEYEEKYPDLRNMRILYNSDAHYLENINMNPKHVDIDEKSIKLVIDYLKK